jgi:hypothetical protein
LAKPGIYQFHTAVRAGRCHPDQGSMRSAHEGVSEKPVFTGEQQSISPLQHSRCNVLEGHHTVEGGDFDPHYTVQTQQGLNGVQLVRDATGGFIEVEGDDRQADLGDRAVNLDAAAIGIR